MWVNISFVVAILLLLGLHSIQGQQSWCNPVSLPATLPFKVPQPNWYQENFLFIAPYNGTVEFRAYVGVSTVSPIVSMATPNVCPNFSANNTEYNTIYEERTSTVVTSIVMKVQQGDNIYLLVHVPGANYTIVGCDYPCPVQCPKDCTSTTNGVCDLTANKCQCTKQWDGEDCSTPSSIAPPPPKKKIPFGSYPLYYTVIAGVPASVFLAIVFVVVVFVVLHKSKKNRDIKMKADNSAATSPLLPNSDWQSIQTAPPLL